MSQVLTRSRGQVKKATTQTVSVPRLRKKVAPKLVSTRPKRSRTSPPKDTTSPSTGSPQDDVSAVNSPSGSEIVAVSSPHEPNDVSVPQSNSRVDILSEPVLLREERHLSSLEMNFDLQARPSDLDNMFANQQTVNSVATDNTSDVLTSKNTIADDTLTFTDDHPYERSCETSLEGNDTHGTKTLPPSLHGDKSGDTEREHVVSISTNNVTADDVTDVGVVKTPEKQGGLHESRTPSRTSKKRTHVDSASVSPDNMSQTTPDKSVSPPRPKKKKNSSVKERKAPDRTKMTMQELIYYNPTANPMMSAKEERERRKQASLPSSPEKETPVSSQVESQQSDTRESQTGIPVDNLESQTESVRNDNSDLAHDDNDRIVPQLQIGADGNIIIDEESMLMDTTANNDSFNNSEAVIETGGQTTSDSFRKSYKITRWSKEETAKFFKALGHVGTDFTMMTLLVPMRSRKELKNKFKREEKKNPHLVAQALKNQINIQRTPSKT